MEYKKFLLILPLFLSGCTTFHSVENKLNHNQNNSSEFCYDFENNSYNKGDIFTYKNNYFICRTNEEDKWKKADNTDILEHLNAVNLDTQLNIQNHEVNKCYSEDKEYSSGAILSYYGIVVFCSKELHWEI